MNHLLKAFLICLNITLTMIIVNPIIVAHLGFGSLPLRDFISLSNRPIPVSEWQGP